MTNAPLQSVYWQAPVLKLLDQRLLPDDIEFLDLTTVEDVWQAIKHLKVRGAPAIGIAAAFGLYLAMRDWQAQTSAEQAKVSFLAALESHAQYLASSRPTAVNLFWAIERMERHAQQFVETTADIEQWKLALLAEAEQIRAEDEETCRLIGEHALTLFHDGIGLLTHCNAGGLATARYGTALAPMYLAHEKGWNIRVFADETRPVLQGARLTAFELQQAGIDVTLICDNMAAMVMSKGWVQAVIVGTDRVAANGDVANKIGTYGLAVLAKAHNIPFYVACPLSTIDLQTADGQSIPIEERDIEEVTEGFGKRTAPVNIRVFNPAFDVTPHEYVTAIITEKGVVRPPYHIHLPELF
jgi:methylthioribose-1-phosphate isomerase